MHDFRQLAMIDGLEVFIATLQFFERFEGRFGHALVGLRGSANQYEFFSAGNAFMSVIAVETEAKQARPFGGLG